MYEVVFMLTDGVIIKGNTPFCGLTVGSSHLTEADALWGEVEGQGIWVHGQAKGTGFPEDELWKMELWQSQEAVVGREGGVHHASRQG